MWQSSGLRLAAELSALAVTCGWILLARRHGVSLPTVAVPCRLASINDRTIPRANESPETAARIDAEPRAQGRLAVWVGKEGSRHDWRRLGQIRSSPGPQSCRYLRYACALMLCDLKVLRGRRGTVLTGY